MRKSPDWRVVATHGAALSLLVVVTIALCAAKLTPSRYTSNSGYHLGVSVANLCTYVSPLCVMAWLVSIFAAPEGHRLECVTYGLVGVGAVLLSAETIVMAAKW